MNKWVLEKMKPETLVGSRMTKLKLSNLGQIMRRLGSLEKTIILGKKAAGQEEDHV